jgi:fido (protein-threonine AMPylation protein)
VGLLHKPNFRLVGGDYVYILLISGIVVSTVNTNVSEPLLYLVDWELLETLDCPLRCPLRPSNSSFLRLPAAKVSGGLIFEFFSNIMPVLSTTDLAGGTFLEDNHRQQENEITHFLEHHKALQTISRVVSGTTSLFGDNAPTIQQSEYYQSALREFVSAQLDRQKASLTSNTGRQDAATSTKIAEQHALCLKRALEDDLTAPGLTPELLCRWHGILCGEGLHVHAGKLRPRNVHVRVGNVSFRPSSHIAGDLDQVCRALNALEGRLFHSDQHPTTHSGNDNHQRSVARDASPGLAAVTFAVAVFFGIGDTHAFADGNGRLARIAANWALRRAGLPFCVHFFATAVQRKEYSTATSLTRRNLYLKSRGHVSQERLLDCFRDGKCLQPLVVLFLDRIHKAVAEFSALVKEKSSLSLDQNEARAARMFRERAATGNCFMYVRRWCVCFFLRRIMLAKKVYSSFSVSHIQLL